ncbi:hypothetical protein FO519_000237 [Halicephalobus sp. NKZ332]|nr:hypothetical protein FO519_000237 [Halicephalobus sp. NKZ332]
MPESFTDWYQFGSTSLRKVPLHKNLGLPIADGCCFSCCPYGGPIAVGDSRLNSGDNIYILTSSGDLLCSITAPFHQLFWTKDQKLVVLNKDSTVSLFSVHGDQLATFTLLKTPRPTSVFARTFFKQQETGFFMVDNAQQMYFVNSVSHRVPWSLSPPQRTTGTLTCFTIVCNSQMTSVILCYGEQFYIGSQKSEVQQITKPWIHTDGGQYVAACTSWSNNKVAFVHNSMCVQIVSDDLNQLLHTISISESLLNVKLNWCGEDVLVFQESSSQLVFYSMSGDSHSMPSLKPVFFDVDSDGIRVFQGDESFLITVVPEAMEDVLGISKTPGMVLFFAYQCYTRKDFSTFDFLTTIRSNLCEAMDQCLTAAAGPFDISLQKQLVEAVNFGRSMCFNYDPTKFMYTCSILRCLNAVRSIGIPISFAEIEELGLTSLIDRLTELRHWPLALELCKIMNVPSEQGTMKVIINWINFLLDRVALTRSMDADLMAEKILHQLKKSPNINYAEVAETIYNKDRKNFVQLANLILNHESDIVKRVKVLMKFGDVKAALELVNESHLPNLAYMVISNLKQTEKKGEVENLLRKTPFAARLYQGYAREGSPNVLLTLYKQQNDFLRQSVVHLSAAELENNIFDPKPRNMLLQEAERCFSQMGNQDLEQLVKSSVILSQQNAVYDSEKRTNLINESVRETFIYAVGEGNDPDLAERLRKEHRLTEKQVWKWTVEALIKSHKTSNLNDMVFKKQFPGYLSFVEACVRCGDLDLASEFCTRVERPTDRVRALYLVGKIIEAANVAFENDDISWIQKLIPLCDNKEDRDKLLGFWIIKMKAAFNHVASFRRGSAVFNLYRSVRTGFDVLIINHTVPTVSACINFATKPFDDSGLPHTLEHLCFMGSQKYPFKGFLDSIANQTGASGTNGYTNEDHTSYTITNVGIQGFLKVLPVYLDHLLNPQLLKEHFTTEVHHIKEDGEDGGVVFSELQGCEHDPDEITDRSLRQYIYPEGNPFRYSSGGTVDGVRYTCNVEAVRKFHKDQYILPNMSLVVMCPDSPDNVPLILEVLKAFEDSQDDPSLNSMVFRPFRDIDVPTVYPDDHVKILFPSTENTGVFFSFWQGPEVMSDDCAGLDVCLNYLCSGPDSPLEKAFVQTGICSEVSPWVRKNKRMEIGFRFGGVHHKYLKGYLNDKVTFRDKLLRTIKKAVVDFDPDRIFYILKSAHEDENYSLEGECVEHFNELFMLFRNYASDGSEKDGEALKRLCSDRFLDLRSYDIKTYFPDLIQKYMSSNTITFATIPDRAAAEMRDQNEEQLIESRIKTLGIDALKEYQDKLDAAISSISVNLPPSELIKSFNVPSTIIMPYAINRIIPNETNVCYPIVLHKVGCTGYVAVKIFFNISSIPAEYRPYLQLYIDTITELDAVIDGNLVTCDELTSNRKRDFVDFNVRFGHCGTFRECIVFKFILYPNENNFSKVAEWMDIFLKKLKYDEKKVKISCDRLSHEASERQLDSANILSDLMDFLTANPNYSIKYQSVIASLDFHQRAFNSSNRTTLKLKNFASEFQKNIPFQVHIAGPPESIDTYLSMCEGPLWKRVRGEGLAYGVSTHVFPLGALVLSINDSPNIMAAYKAVEECVSEIFANPDISPVDFIAAKNSLLAEIVEEVNHPHSAAAQSITDFLGGSEKDFHFVRFALDSIEKATVEDVLKFALPIFFNLFNNAHFVRGIVIPSKSKEKLLKEYPDFQEHEVSDLGKCFPLKL